ncbi:hypothetical protein [Rhizobium sp.]
MRNITIALDDDDYLRVEREAERKNTSVTEFAKAKLIEASESWTSPVSPEEFERLRQLQEDVRKRITNFSAGDRLTRDELYDRNRDR